jgi:hypothetical protein
MENGRMTVNVELEGMWSDSFFCYFTTLSQLHRLYSIKLDGENEWLIVAFTY